MFKDLIKGLRKIVLENNAWNLRHERFKRPPDGLYQGKSAFYDVAALTNALDDVENVCRKCFGWCHNDSTLVFNVVIEFTHAFNDVTTWASTCPWWFIQNYNNRVVKHDLESKAWKFQLCKQKHAFDDVKKWTHAFNDVTVWAYAFDDVAEWTHSCNDEIEWTNVADVIKWKHAFDDAMDLKEQMSVMIKQ